MFKKIFIPLFVAIFFSSTFSSFAANPLKITQAEVINTKEIKLSFNVAINESSDREFSLENKENNAEEIEIVSSELSESNIILLKLWTDLKVNTKYDLTVISLTWKAWENIQAWVDWIVSITTPEKITKSSSSESVNTDNWTSTDWITTTNNNSWNTIDSNNTNVQNTSEETDLELNAWSDEKELNKTIWWENVWTWLTASSVNTEKLPETWAAEIFLILAALVLAWIFMKYRKNA